MGYGIMVLADMATECVTPTQNIPVGGPPAWPIGVIADQAISRSWSSWFSLGTRVQTPERRLSVVVGVCSTYETERTYLIDNLRVSITAGPRTAAE